MTGDAEPPGPVGLRATGPGELTTWYAAAVTVWGAYVAARLLPHHAEFWREVPRAWSTVPWRELAGPGLLLAPARHLALLALAALFAGSFAGLGGPARVLLAGRLKLSRDRRALDLLAGFALLGAAHLGLALTGLFVPWLTWVLPAAGLALPGARRLAGAVVRGVRGVSWPARRGPLALAALPVLPALLVMLVPDGHVDTWSYHFLIPDQMFRARKYVMDGAPVAFGFPLTAELVYAPAIAAGLDALPHWLQLAPYLAAALQLAWWAEGIGGPGAGWLAGAACFTFGHVQQMMGAGKNDLAAAAYAMAGALALARALHRERGWLAPAALLFGCGAAVKSSGQALAGLAFAALALSARRGTLIRWTALAAIPALPWLVRSWLWWGDPLWPVLSGLLPGALWGPEDAVSVWIVRGRRSVAEALAGAGPDLVGTLVAHQPALALGVPLVVAGVAMLRGAERWLLGFAMGAMILLAALMPAQWIRLAIPAFGLLAASAAIGAVRRSAGWPAWSRGALLWGAGLACWAPTGEYLANWTAPALTLPALAGALTGREYFARRMTTLDDVRAGLARHPPGGRVIGLGEIRFYRLPARFHSVRNYGSTWAWEWSRDCATAERIRVRCRQSGVRTVLYNFVTEGFPHHAAEPYDWTDRQIAVWRTFVERWLELGPPPARLDHANGGFVLYRVRDVPAAASPPWLPYLPGLESLYYTMLAPHDDRVRFERALKVVRRVPDVDWVRTRVSIGPYNARDYETAWLWLETGLRHGTVDDGLWWNGGITALRTRRLAEAERAFRRVVELQPELRDAAQRMADRIRLVIAEQSAPAQ